MASILDQHYMKIVPEPVITSVVAGAGNTITITGTGLTLLTSKHLLTIGLSVSPDQLITSVSPELTTNTDISLVVDLTAVTGEDVTDITISLPNVFNITFDVNPDITVAP